MERDLTERINSVFVGWKQFAELSHSLRNLATKWFLDSPFQPIKTLLNGTWLEHPLHPVVTDVPVGSWTLAMLLDGMDMLTGSESLGEASGIATGFGALAASGAIVTGLMDWTDTDPPEVTVGLAHGLTNILGTTLFTASFLMRWRNGWKTSGSHLLLSALGYGIITFGAYLGGSLVYREGVMINRNAYRKGPKDFTPVMRAEDLPENKPVRVEASGQPVLLVRQGTNIDAIGAVCSHYGGPLEKGRLIDGCVECPWHYSRYSLQDGSYKQGPTTSPVPAYEVQVRDGQIEVKLRR